MAKRKVIFRADGNSEIGLGHIMRSLALAEMLSGEFECEFATRFTTTFIKAEIEKVCSRLYILPVEEEIHFEKFLGLLLGTEIVVLDNYFFNTDYQRKIKALGCKLVCIDDLADKHFVADIIINHAPAISNNIYSAEIYTRFLLGAEYALLRKVFFKKKEEKIDKKEAGNIFLSFGGSDSLGLTLQYLKRLVNLGECKHIYVLISSVNKDKSEIFKFADQTVFKETITVLCDIVPVKVVEILDKTTMAISPASTISYEILVRQNFLILGHYTENQLNIYKGLLGYAGIAGIGDLKKIDIVIDRIRDIILIEKKGNQNIIDCRSPQRITKHFLEL